MEDTLDSSPKRELNRSESSRRFGNSFAVQRFGRDTIRGGIEMHDPDAGEYTEEGSASLVHYGRVIDDEEYANAMLGYKDDDVIGWLDQLVESDAHTIVFQGCDAIRSRN